MRVINSRMIIGGVLGMILGAIAQELVNGMAGGMVIRDGLLWGAVAGVALASTPNFLQMGSHFRTENRALQFIVGLAAFVLISAVIIVAFLAIFSVLARLFLGANSR
jgi:hypothetical protein